MKGYIAIILLLVSTGIATYLFQQKHKNQTDLIDIHTEGLTAIVEILPQNATIYYDPTSSVDFEVFSRVRYILSPRNIHIAKNRKVDTMLSIININAYESAYSGILSKVIIDTKHGDNYYILSTSK